MAATNPPAGDPRSTSEFDESSIPDGGVGMNHLTVVPANFASDGAES